MGGMGGTGGRGCGGREAAGAAGETKTHLACAKIVREFFPKVPKINAANAARRE